MAVELDLDIT